MSAAEWIMALVLVLGVVAAAFAARAFQEHSVGRYKPPAPPAGSPPGT